MQNWYTDPKQKFYVRHNRSMPIYFCVIHLWSNLRVVKDKLIFYMKQVNKMRPNNYRPPS
jgi:hypothetical protein